MRVIVCVDERGGMSFGGKRQSRDRVVIDRILKLTADVNLWMNSYSAGQFETRENICVAEAFLDMASPQDWCFAETQDLSAWAEQIREIVIYRWNRHYPSDLKFPEHLFASRWQLESSCEFSGYSHETITQEVYRL